MRVLRLLLCALPLVVTTPAHADVPLSDTVNYAGTGTISPGFPCDRPCTVHFNFTAAFAGDEGEGTASCVLDGTETGSLQVSQGGGSGSCSNGATFLVSWNRVGSLKLYSGTVMLGIEKHSIVVGVAQWTPTSSDGSTYAESGTWLLDS